MRRLRSIYTPRRLEGSTIIRNVHTCSPTDTAQYPRRLEFSSTSIGLQKFCYRNTPKSSSTIHIVLSFHLLCPILPPTLSYPSTYFVHPSTYFVLSFHLLCPTLPPTLSYPFTYFVLPFHLLCPTLSLLCPTLSPTLSYPFTYFVLPFHLLCPILPPTLPYPSTYFVLSFHLLCPILPPTSILYNPPYFAVLVYFSSLNFILG